MIYQLEKHIADKLKEFFSKYDFIERVDIFGSRGRGDCEPMSDIDMVIYSKKMSYQEFLKLKSEVEELPILLKMDLVHYEKSSQELRENIKRDRKVLYMKKRELPKGWRVEKLGDICEFMTKSKIKASEGLNFGKFPFYTSSKILSKYINKSIFNLSEALVFGTGGNASIHYATNEFSTSTDCFTLKPISEDIKVKYIYYYLFGNIYILENGFKGAGLKHISKRYIENISIPFPSIQLQKKIADILDKSSNLIEKQKEVLAKYDLLLKSKFIEMFGDPVKNPIGWEVVKLRDMFSSVNYGTSQKAHINKNGIPILRMNNITYSGYLNINDLKYIELSENDEKKYILEKGDILFNRTNSKELVGKTTVFNLSEKYSFAGYLVRAKTNEKANPYFISYFLNSDYGKAVLFYMAKNIVGMANINAQEMQNINCYLPPLNLQIQFAKIVEKVEAIKEVENKRLNEFETLHSALMQRAFNGEIE